MSIEKSFREILNNLDEEKKYMDKEVFENTPKRIEEFYKEFFSGMYTRSLQFSEKNF